MKSNTKLIKVLYNDGKCYECNGDNFLDIKKDGTVRCLNCSIDVVIFDYITKDEYKHFFCFSPKNVKKEVKDVPSVNTKILQAGTTLEYSDNVSFCAIN